MVSDDDERFTEPGGRGCLAVGGRQPIGYYTDPETSARAFIMVDGRRYSCPGDYAVLDEDGTVSVLGRGSVCVWQHATSEV